MLCQNVCVVPFGIMAIVSVDDDEEFAALLHALDASARHTARKTGIKTRTLKRFCIRIFPQLSAFITALGAPPPCARRIRPSLGPQALSIASKTASRFRRRWNPVHFAVVRQWPCERYQSPRHSRPRA